MKEYKLKQWYPSLPSNWKNQDPMVVVEREMGYEPHPSIQGVSYKCIHPQEMINSEFWEELKPYIPEQKEYEITKLRAGNNIFTKFQTYGGETRWYREDCSIGEGNYSKLKVGDLYGNQPLEIYSIERISDREVFTVGDKVRLEHNKKSISKEIIKIGLEKLGKCPEQLFIYTEGEQSTINNYVHSKQPLFTTEDGIGIYDGDTYYWVGDDNYRDNSICKKWEVSKPCKIEHNHVSFVVGVHTFSTKEAAENYILMNKKLISANDLLKYLKEQNSKMDRLGNSFMKFLKREVNL